MGRGSCHKQGSAHICSQIAHQCALPHLPLIWKRYGQKSYFPLNSKVNFCFQRTESENVWSAVLTALRKKVKLLLSSAETEYNTLKNEQFRQAQEELECSTNGTINCFIFYCIK